MTQQEQVRSAAETMAWIRDIGRQLKRQEAKIDERNGRMAAQQYQHQKGKRDGAD